MSQKNGTLFIFVITNARFYQLRLNLGTAIPTSEDNPRFSLGLSFGIYQRCLTSE